MGIPHLSSCNAWETGVLICKNSQRNNPCYNSAAMQNAVFSAPTSLVPPEDCADMAALRVAIDALDAKLVRLLALRQAYIERAAVLKKDRATIRDEARIEDVVQKVLAEARAAGLSPAIAESVWRVLIERSIAHEFVKFDAK